MRKPITVRTHYFDIHLTSDPRKRRAHYSFRVAKLKQRQLNHYTYRSFDLQFTPFVPRNRPTKHNTMAGENPSPTDGNVEGISDAPEQSTTADQSKLGQQKSTAFQEPIFTRSPKNPSSLHRRPTLSPLRKESKSPEREMVPKSRHLSRRFSRGARYLWLDILTLLLVGGICAIVHFIAPIFEQGSRVFAVSYDGIDGKREWRGPHELSYPFYSRDRKNITLPNMLEGPEFIVPIVELSVALPIVIGLALILMQIWIRDLWDKIAALVAFYKTLAYA